jgi:hypothetical protein
VFSVQVFRCRRVFRCSGVQVFRSLVSSLGSLVSSLGSLVLRAYGALVCRFSLPIQREGVGPGEVHEADGDAGGQPEMEGLPLRGEPGEGVVGGAAGLVAGVDEQRDRRPHPLVEQERQHGLGVGGAFHQDGVRAQLLQRAAEAAGGAGAVMPDPEDVDRRAHEISLQAR